MYIGQFVQIDTHFMSDETAYREGHYGVIVAVDDDEVNVMFKDGSDSFYEPQDITILIDPELIEMLDGHFLRAGWLSDEEMAWLNFAEIQNRE